MRRDPHRRHSVPGEPLLRGRIGGAYVTPPAIDTAFISASGWDSRGIFTLMRTRLPSRRPSAVSARSILLCDSSKYNQVATFMALPLTRFTTIITDRHLSDAAASHIARHACEVLRADNARGHRRVSVASARSAPRRSRRFADSLGHARRGIPQINHHDALCFVIRAKQGDNPARTRSPAPVLSAINQPAGSTERINGPATRSSTIHCSSCRCERALDAGWSAACAGSRPCWPG